uniref:Uncharacterized protein n=1 Tax=Cryptosporidium parvum TaxID=5807 RepID=F0X563_CRYPV
MFSPMYDAEFFLTPVLILLAWLSMEIEPILSSQYS